MWCVYVSLCVVHMWSVPLLWSHSTPLTRRHPGSGQQLPKPSQYNYVPQPVHYIHTLTLTHIQHITCRGIIKDVTLYVHVCPHTMHIIPQTDGGCSSQDGRVRYKEFCDMMENAYNEPDLEKKPTTSVYRPLRGHLSRVCPHNACAQYIIIIFMYIHNIAEYVQHNLHVYCIVIHFYNK